MDTETTQRINTLAKELSKKGLAPSSGDAFKMAENILKDEISNAQEENKAVEPLEKYEILLERANRKMGHELDSLREQLNSFKKQISMVSDELTFIREDLKKLKLAKKEIKSEKQDVLVKKEVKEKSSKPGDYKPEDIAIDKIFYCGKKQ